MPTLPPHSRSQAVQLVEVPSDETPWGQDEGIDMAPLDPTVKLLILHMEEQHKSASEERQNQTKSFTDSLEKLGERFEAKMDAQTQAMAKTAYLVAGIMVFALGLLGSIAGAVTVYRGNGMEIQVGKDAVGQSVDDKDE